MGQAAPKPCVGGEMQTPLNNTAVDSRINLYISCAGDTRPPSDYLQALPREFLTAHLKLQSLG